jgi:tRNA(fMet)-specific endonuclease VapC
MNRFILDTNICLAYIRGNRKFCEEIDKCLDLFKPDVQVIISVVTKAELLSLGVQNGWGKNKLNNLKKILNKLFVIDINESDSDLMEAYAKIDAYSQGRLPEQPLEMSARNMGKNDLWIAATAYLANAALVTTDGDFDHLHDKWITVYKFLWTATL